MAINVDQITTDITLELDEEVISIADFQKGTDNFLGLVKELSKQVAGNNADSGEWLVKVYSGSAAVGVMPSAQNLNADKVREIMISGIRSLANGIRPGEFSDKAIECAKSLASLFKKSSVEPNVRIWSKKEESIHVVRKVAIEAENILAPAYEEQGAVEGILERVDAHGKLQFVIYDVIDDRAVKCEVNESQLQQALENFKKRVEVVGTVKFRKDGMPVSIKASRIINFPSKSEIPTLAQMRVLLAGGASA
ncbi:MAG: hypothetical protein G3I11_03075 [Ferrovum sp.]|nr:hypothetical protein [Ferrovum sp.]